MQVILNMGQWISRQVAKNKYPLGLKPQDAEAEAIMINLQNKNEIKEKHKPGWHEFSYRIRGGAHGAR